MKLSRVAAGLALLSGILSLVFVAALPAAGGQAFTEPVAIVSGDARHTFRAEIADTAQARSQGLMYRRQLAPDAGMLFDFKHVGEVTMWMADTYIPLDMLFIRADGVIHRIEADTVPFSRQTIASRGPVLAVLEVPAGTARRLAIKPGDLVEHPIFSSDR